MGKKKKSSNVTQEGQPGPGQPPAGAEGGQEPVERKVDEPDGKTKPVPQATSSHDAEKPPEGEGDSGNQPKSKKKKKGKKDADSSAQPPGSDLSSEMGQLSLEPAKPDPTPKEAAGQKPKKQSQPQKKADPPKGAPVKKPVGAGIWKPVPMNINDISPPQRPALHYCGTEGRKINLTTNLFEITVKNKNVQIYHYNVTILDHRNLEGLPKKKKMKVFEAFKKSYPKLFDNVPFGFDSEKNAYSTTLVRQFLVEKNKKAVPYEVEVLMDVDNKKKSKFKVSMEKVGEASLMELLNSMKFDPGRKSQTPTTIIQMVEVMFRHYRSIKYEQVSRRNFFGIDEEFSQHVEIGGGKQGVSGFFGSVRTSAWKNGTLLLNLNMANTAFYKEQSVIDFLKEQRDIRIFDFAQTISGPTLYRVEKLLKGLRLKTTHVPRTYKFLKLLPQGADSTKFELTKDGKTRKITVQEYFRMEHGINLSCPKLNCVHVGNPERNIYIPLELCKIAKGQKVQKKLSDFELSTFIRSTAIPPDRRLDQIKRVVAKNDFNRDPMLNALTFTVSEHPLKTEGRVLPEPGLKMDKNFKPRDGQWDIRDKRFYQAAALNHWAVINYDQRTQDRDIQKFVGMLVSMGKEKAMAIDKPFDIYTYKGRGDPNPLEDFKHYKAKNSALQLIMCILPGRRYYGSIKRAGDTEVEVITQCVQGMNVQKCQPQTVGNLLLKINGKMDGVNNIVALSNNQPLVVFPKAPGARYLIMGADVNHPPVGADENIPSIAAVVGSYDQHATKYAVECRSQYHRVEMIKDLQEITVNLLKTFYRSTRNKPTHIVMYRDGVSESQFTQVLAEEMMAMRAACTSLQAEYEPGITFICVQKRHHVRLFCDRRDGVGKSGNIPPGTIVDKDITHPTETDFYLCSHQGIQGTSRPTHYHLLWDDNDLELNELQQLTYRLCHVYSRCSRVVSIPAPVYYAHLAAFRAKVYVGEFIDESEAGSLASGRTDIARIKAEITRTTKIGSGQTLANRFYYI